MANVFGCVRFVYNKALKLRTDSFKDGKPINYAQSDKALTGWKKESELAFLRDVPSVPLQQSLRQLQTAFSNFFAKRAKYPTFKKKSAEQSASYVGHSIKLDSNKNLRIRGLGRLDVHWSREFESKPTTVTITKKPDGRYFVTLCLDGKKDKLPKTGKKIGIDLGVSRLATLSNGERIKNPKHLSKKLKKLARAQRILARRKKGSGRWNRQRIKVARIHSRIADSRKDALDKATTDIVRRFDVIAIEDLNLRVMVKNRKLSRAIFDAGMGMFRRMLEYKADWYGKEIRICDPFYPSSKRCSGCGFILEKLPLSVREWDCPECGKHHDRDENAAINILAGGQPASARGERVRPVLAKAKKGCARRNVNQSALCKS